MSDLPSWLGRKAVLKRQNTRSQAQERKVAEEVSGKVQRGSGSSWRAPRDVKSPNALIEVKYTDKSSYLLYAEMWQKYRVDAWQAGREPEMIIEFSKLGIRLKVVEI